jgi:hypothetical protein
VNPPVGGLLAHKTLYFGAKPFLVLRWQRFEASAHRIHKVLLAQRETHGQRTEKSGPESVASIPACREWGVQVDEQFSDN